MWPIFEALGSRPDFVLILALPVLGAVLGGGGNWLSHRILFGPLPIGGRDRSILVSRADEVAARLAPILAARLRLSELFRLMEPEKVAGHVSAAVVARLDEYVDDVMTARHAVLWANLPQLLRQRIYARVGRQLPSIMDNLVEDMAENIDELVDLSLLLDGFIAGNRAALADLLEQVLEEECRFMRRAGAWVGLVLGLAQALLWIHLPSTWGAIGVGMLIPVMAMLVPRALLVSERTGSSSGLSRWLRDDKSRLTQRLSHSLVEEVLGLRHLMQRMVAGPRSSRARSMIRRHMRPLLDAGVVRTTLQMLLGAEGYAHLKHLVVEKAVTATAELLSDVEFSQARAVVMQATCDQRLASMSSSELRGLVQVALDEGLYTRLAVLAGIGGLFGALQAALMSLLAV